jgi:hypothetical protein
MMCVGSATQFSFSPRPSPGDQTVYDFNDLVDEIPPEVFQSNFDNTIPDDNGDDYTLKVGNPLNPIDFRSADDVQVSDEPFDTDPILDANDANTGKDHTWARGGG